MNTHDIELPPLPPGYKSYEFPDGGYDEDDMRTYARAAVESDRKRRGEPVGEIQCRIYHDTEQHRDYLKARFHPDTWKNRVSFEWHGHRWAYRYTHFDDSGEYDLIARTAPQPAEPSRSEPVACFKCGHAKHGGECVNVAPQPAEPVKVPSDMDILELWSGDPTHSRPVLGKNKVLSFAHALLARYGWPTKQGTDESDEPQPFPSVSKQPCPPCAPVDGKRGSSVQGAWHAGWDASRDALPRITDADIQRIMLKHGYTVKPGHDDLKPYVYAAARELIALAAGLDEWRPEG